MATLAQVRNKALRMLGVLGAGREASGPQDADMSAAYDEVYAELEELNLVEWANDQDVPARFVDSVVALVASRRVDEYGVSGERYQRIMGKAGSSEARIRRLLADDYVHNVTQFVDY